MCGRFANHIQAMRGWTELLGIWPGDSTLSYNVAPTQMIPVVSQNGLGTMRWGLIPSWSKTTKMKYATFNARVETMKEKPAYRNAWRKGQRCIIPALGYYEWKAVGKIKQPYFIYAEDGAPLGFAGLCESHEIDGVGGESCTILTRAANEQTIDLHPRIPVLLTPAAAATWLACSPAEASEIALDYTAPALSYHAVSTEVNRASNDQPALINPVLAKEE